MLRMTRDESRMASGRLFQVRGPATWLYVILADASPPWETKDITPVPALNYCWQLHGDIDNFSDYQPSSIVSSSVCYPVPDISGDGVLFLIDFFLCFFVSKITRKRLDQFAWNFQGRCGVTMGRPGCILGQIPLDDAMIKLIVVLGPSCAAI